MIKMETKVILNDFASVSFKFKDSEVIFNELSYFFINFNLHLFLI